MDVDYGVTNVFFLDSSGPTALEDLAYDHLEDEKKQFSSRTRNFSEEES